MGISWLDVFLMMVTVALVFWEIRRDLGQSLFDTLALLLGLRLAIGLGPLLAAHLGFATPTQARGVALLFLFVIGSAAGLALGYYLNSVTRWTLDTFDRVAGLLLGFSAAVIVCHVFVTSLALMYPGASGPPTFVTRSTLGQEALSFHTFQQVMQFFDRLHT